MHMTGNTILITGGGSGIGRGLAGAFHARGNKVIISGRRRTALEATVAANPGMEAVELDVTDPASIASVTTSLVRDHPTLNEQRRHHAGGRRRRPDGRGRPGLHHRHEPDGPDRLTSALLDHLRTQDSPVVDYTTSFLADVQMAVTAVYSATKAALPHLHSVAALLLAGQPRARARDRAPWTRTELMNGSHVELAMPLDAFIAETMQALETEADEILVERARPMRASVGPAEAAMVTEFNERALAFYQGCREHRPTTNPTGENTMAEYIAHATTVGGRNGHVESSDGLLKADLSTPKSIGGPGRDGTSNPEQFFAAGYSSCFGASVEYAAFLEKVKIGPVTVTADVALTVDDSGYNLAVNLKTHVDGVDRATAQRLVDKAHNEICTYSKATRNNIPVTTEVI